MHYEEQLQHIKPLVDKIFDGFGTRNEQAKKGGDVDASDLRIIDKMP
jgi:hypothetical protein